MNLTIPGRSLDPQFESLWRRFERLDYTVDSLDSRSMRLRRWLTPVNVSFIIPIEDPAVYEYLAEAQRPLIPHMVYTPQPADKLHITLYQIGYLRQLPFRLPGTWSHNELKRMADVAGESLRMMRPFRVQIGPVNAFPNVAIAEVRDEGRLRLLHSIVARATPPLSIQLNYPLIPHITLGFFGKLPAAPIRNALRPLRKLPRILFNVEQVELTLYYRKVGPYDPSQALQHSAEEILYSLPLGEGT
ncbi:MAG: 2'-5' RNA ligase family protein [Chloroflexota bacterium]